MWTHADVLNKTCTHDEYFGQFVCDRISDYVQRVIGIDRIRESSNPHFNDIPLKEWDEMHHAMLLFTTEWRKQGLIGNSLADSVCLAKACAKKLRQPIELGSLFED